MSKREEYAAPCFRRKPRTREFPIETTRFGFIYGPANIERLCDDRRVGVFIGVLTNREQMEIRVTPGGRISVYRHEKIKK